MIRTRHGARSGWSFFPKLYEILRAFLDDYLADRLDGWFADEDEPESDEESDNKGAQVRVL